MNKLTIERLSDESDCETCGMSWAEGAVVKLNDQTILELEPFASCFGGKSWTDADVYHEILKYLGYIVEEIDSE